MKGAASGDRLRAWGAGACLLGAAVGAVWLAGWLLGVDAITGMFPEQAPVMPNTALCLLLAGVAGSLCGERCVGLRRAVVLVAATVVLAIGVATLAEYGLRVDLGIDRLVVDTRIGPHPGRMSPLTAGALACLGAALLLFDRRPRGRIRPPEWLAVAAWLVAFTAALGEIFGTGPLYLLEDEAVIGVAVPTALGLLLIATGLLLARPEAGIMHLVASNGPGGVLMRRLALAAVVAPVLANLTLSRLLGSIGLEQLPVVYATVATTATVIGLFLIVLTAFPLERTHEALLASRARTRALFEQAIDAIFVADREGHYTDVNAAGCDLLGFTADELRKKTILDLIPPEDIARFEAHRDRIFAGEPEVGEWTLCRKDGTRVSVEVSAKLLPDGRWQAFVRDISERRRAQEQVRHAMERFDLALRGADLATWDWDVGSGEVGFNARWAEMRGFRLDEIEPHVDTWIAGVHPDDWPRVSQALTDHFEGRTSEYEAEHRVATKDGGWIWVLDRGRVFGRDEQGRPRRMVGTELDITERKHTEEALRLSEAKFSGIVSISPDAIVSIDEDQRITMFNAGAEEAFGWSSEEVIGAPLDILIPERFRPIHRRHVLEFAAGTQTARRAGRDRAPVVGLKKDGEEFLAEASISKLDVGGARLYTASLRDVTEQRRQQRESELLAQLGRDLGSTFEVGEALEHFSELAAANVADVCLIDLLETEHEPRHLHVVVAQASMKKAGERLQRLATEGMPLHLASRVVATRTPVLWTRASKADIEALAPTSEHLALVRALQPQSVIIVPLVTRDEVLGALGLVSSSPARVYRAPDLRFAEELAQRLAISIENARLYRATQRALRARDDVLGVVAHDLRNPLGVIMLQSTLLIRAPRGEADTRKAGEAIERSASRMNRLIQDLLDVTRIDAGRMTLEQDLVAPGQLLAETEESQRALADERSLELRVDLAPDLPDVWADRDRILQVLENLVGNAVKFTEPGGRIIAGAAPRDRDVLFWVADTGPGIAPGDLPHLFDRFWQTRKARRRGAGLGLPIVKGIVEAHGGRVWVDSTPGRGSTFFFTIPRMLPAERALPQPAPPGA